MAGVSECVCGVCVWGGWWEGNGVGVGEADELGPCGPRRGCWLIPWVTWEPQGNSEQRRLFWPHRGETVRGMSSCQETSGEAAAKSR